MSSGQTIRPAGAGACRSSRLAVASGARLVDKRVSGDLGRGPTPAGEAIRHRAPAPNARRPGDVTTLVAPLARGEFVPVIDGRQQGKAHSAQRAARLAGGDSICTQPEDAVPPGRKAVLPDNLSAPRSVDRGGRPQRGLPIKGARAGAGLQRLAEVARCTPRGHAAAAVAAAAAVTDTAARGRGLHRDVCGICGFARIRDRTQVAVGAALPDSPDPRDHAAAPPGPSGSARRGIAARRRVRGAHV